MDRAAPHTGVVVVAHLPRAPHLLRRDPGVTGVYSHGRIWGPGTPPDANYRGHFKKKKEKNRWIGPCSSPYGRCPRTRPKSGVFRIAEPH